ncbi:hypothetical protein C5Y96_13975 [Blastopirellula marina]|uniref:DUF676 domain-containing protein n=1 Tax=Blastopirellula marina TaxID=124 RepID=A0A2S8FF74_9BACT|nr:MULTISPECIES: hypothetical protein [Pirellulaceae]PQO30574.1 hypothetical protein C5Y96_13975 [Blastopirellula marina]RCS50711.1 hypothetical protein DTL36_13985 [Bremerella cremea]
MAPTIPAVPSKDGDVNTYNLLNIPANTPRLYYVNGIRNSAKDHALTASLLSILCEHPVQGVYNQSNGAILDLGQCLLDYTQNASARVFGNRKLVPGKTLRDDEVQKIVDETIKGSFVWNQATVTLFKEVANNYGRNTLIVAHSQGNLITSNALFIIERVFGSAALKYVRVYSLASPSPAWPLGLRYTNGGGGRQENAFMNDLVSLLRPHNLAAKVGVTRFQNAGDFRTHAGAGTVSLTPHGVNENIALNFLQSIRVDLGKTKEFAPDFLEKSNKMAEDAIKMIGVNK